MIIRCSHGNFIITNQNKIKISDIKEGEQAGFNCHIPLLFIYYYTKMGKALFITGIGTDIGKSWATGWLANTLRNEGNSVITQKFIQTGNQDVSEDIELHRKIMNIPMQTEDVLHITAPVIFSYPASPHLASKIDNREIDFNAIDTATSQLANRYDFVLIEGAGGVMVPLTDTYLTIDYIEQRGHPAVVVTNGKLGSISDTLLTLEALDRRGIEIYAAIYNPHFDKDPIISKDAAEFMEKWVSHNYPSARWMRMPEKI